MRLACLALCLLIAGCATVDDNPGRVIAGPRTEAPWGFTDMCNREPWQRDCGGNGIKP